MRVVLMPLLRGAGVDPGQARAVQDALSVVLITQTEAEQVPPKALDAGAKASRVTKALAALRDRPPAGVLAQQLAAMATMAGLQRVLLARLDTTAAGTRLLLVAVEADEGHVWLAAHIIWRGPFQATMPALQGSVRRWVGEQVGRAALAEDQWPVGALPVGESDPAPPEPAGSVEFIPVPGAGAAGSATGPAQPATPLGVTAEARTNYYADNDGNRIVTPTVAVAGNIGETWTLAGHAALDMMTCASVDVVSAATSRGYFQENRQEYGAAVTGKKEQLGVTLGAVRSTENDYSSATASLAISDEFAQRNATLSLAYSFTGSKVGRAHDPNFSRRLDSHALTLSWTQVLGRQWIGQLSGFVGVLDGFQSSVYRFVHFSDGSHGPEVAPDFRLREAVAAELRGSLSPSWFTGLSYRLYLDTWGLLAHTGEVTLTYAATDWLSVRIRDRGYLQRGATFYQSVFERPMRYMSIDRELGTMRGNLMGVKLAIDLGRPGRSSTWEFDLKYDWMWQHFDDFPWLANRYMSMVEAGIQYVF